MRKYIAIIIASLALFTGQAHAQRCLPKMQGIEVRANMADGFNPGGKNGGYSFGAALSTYTKKGNKWVFGGEYLLVPFLCVGAGRLLRNSAMESQRRRPKIISPKTLSQTLPTPRTKKLMME